jgi:uroporphyrinogen-III synthase
MAALRGVGVLVTRPEHQATPLCRLLEAEGACTFRLPAIEVRGIAERRPSSDRWGPLERFDLIVFVSANAVRFGASLLEQRCDLSLAAIGPATARALNQAGYRVAIVPSTGYDSESLLADPRLAQLTGKRVLLVKGKEGRDALQAELARRGASVEAADVYERIPAVPKPADLRRAEEALRSGEIQVVTATSLEIGENILRSAAPPLRELLLAAHWLIASGRIGSGLAHWGLQHAAILAASAEDHDLVAALLQWRAGVSDA